VTCSELYFLVCLFIKILYKLIKIAATTIIKTPLLKSNFPFSANDTIAIPQNETTVPIRDMRLIFSFKISEENIPVKIGAEPIRKDPVAADILCCAELKTNIYNAIPMNPVIKRSGKSLLAGKGVFFMAKV